MRISTLLLSVLFSVTAFSAPKATQKVLKEVYQSYQYMGVGVGNHSSIQSLRSIDQFLLETASFDQDFKYVFVEGPQDIQEILIQASIGALSITEMESRIGEYWMLRIRYNPQWNQLVYGTLPLIQSLNRMRPENPIKMVAIDSYTRPRSELDEHMMQNKLPGYYFGGSTTREILTAANFELFESSNEPGKGIIYYHQAHILKNLDAMGYENNEDNELVRYGMGPLGWVGFMEASSPGFLDRMGVVVFNEKDQEMNPSGVLDLSLLPDLYLGGMGTLVTDLPLLSSETFYIRKDAFLGRYRGGSISIPEDPKKTFEAFVNY